jgi:hypothetical protein
MRLLGKQAGSAAAEPGETLKTFTEFEWATSAGQSMRLVELIADVGGVDAGIVEHVAGWLVGRATWSAAFVHTWLDVAAQFDASERVPEPRDLFFPFAGAAPTGPSLVMHLALGVFVDEMTASRKVQTFWHSSCWGLTPGRVVTRLREDPGHGRGLELSVLSHAALIFSCSGARVRMAGLAPALDPVTLVELGLCCLDRQDKDNAALSGLVTLAEPLVVEAIMRAEP